METTMKRTLLGALALGLLSAPAWAGSGPACKASAQECLDHMTKDLASHGWLGVHLEPKEDGSMAIVDVVPESPASKAGLKPADVLLALGGVRFGAENEEALKKVKGDWAPGQKVTYTVSRGGKEMPVDVTLAEMPDQVRYEIIGQHMMEMHSASALASADLHELSVDEVVKALEVGKIAALYDVNGADTRAKFGVVPKATLLTSSSSYDLSSLPKDKAAFVVFYCANTRCTASDTAARRAMEAGYKNVAVMRPGIAGWKDAGRPTTPPPQS
jgi:rhodanese-related sulfurtransferase